MLVKHFNLTKNKGIEFQISRWGDAKLFNIEIWKRTKDEDHMGLTISITLFYHELSIDFYDYRHREDYGN